MIDIKTPACLKQIFKTLMQISLNSLQSGLIMTEQLGVETTVNYMKMELFQRERQDGRWEEAKKKK